MYGSIQYILNEIKMYGEQQITETNHNWIKTIKTESILTQHVCSNDFFALDKWFIHFLTSLSSFSIS